MKINTASQTTKITIIVIGTIIALLLAYTAAAYSLMLWPFNKAAIVAPEGNNQTSQQTSAESEIRHPTVTFTNAIVLEDHDIKTLRVAVKVDTDKQGDCTLTLKNGKHIHTLENSTKGVKNASGCLEWNIGASSLKKGTYEATVEFVGEKSQGSATEMIEVK